MQVAPSSAECQASNASSGNYPQGSGKTEGLCLAIEFAQHQPRFGARGSTSGIYAYALHARKINHEAAVTNGLAGYAMTSAANRYDQITVSGKKYGRNNVSRAGTAHDGGWPAVDHCVGNCASGVITILPRAEHRPAYTSFKLVNSSDIHRGASFGKREVTYEPGGRGVPCREIRR